MILQTFALVPDLGAGYHSGFVTECEVTVRERRRASPGWRVAVVLPLVFLACTDNEPRHEAWNSLVETERQFAQAAQTHGMKVAFLRYLHDESILFQNSSSTVIHTWKSERLANLTGPGLFPRSISIGGSKRISDPFPLATANAPVSTGIG